MVLLHSNHEPKAHSTTMPGTEELIVRAAALATAIEHSIVETSSIPSSRPAIAINLARSRQGSEIPRQSCAPVRPLARGHMHEKKVLKRAFVHGRECADEANLSSSSLQARIFVRTLKL
jgi:hypothetical protein